MDITNVDKDPMYKKKLAEAKAKVAKTKAAKKKAEAEAIRKMRSNPANYDQKGRYGFDGMAGQTGPGSKLKGK